MLRKQMDPLTVISRDGKAPDGGSRPAPGRRAIANLLRLCRDDLGWGVRSLQCTWLLSDQVKHKGAAGWDVKAAEGGEGRRKES